jgi:hypothetical protein
MPKNYTIMTITGCVLPIRTMRDRDERRREREREREVKMSMTVKREIFFFLIKRIVYGIRLKIYILF